MDIQELLIGGAIGGLITNEMLKTHQKKGQKIIRVEDYSWCDKADLLFGSKDYEGFLTYLDSLLCKSANFKSFAEIWC